MSLWFHPLCAAYKRPEPLLETLPEAPTNLPDRETLEQAARAGTVHHRLQRLNGAERAPTGQAKCRHCQEPIARGSWRIRLAFFDEGGGRFSPGGFVHLTCRQTYFETDDVLERLLYFSPDLSDDDQNELIRACQTDTSATRVTPGLTGDTRA